MLDETAVQVQCDTGGFFASTPTEFFRLLSLSQWTLKKKSLNFIFPTKYVIPKSLKFSHWPSKFLKNLTDSQQVLVSGMLQLPWASLASQKHLNNFELAIRKAAEMPKPRKNGKKKTTPRSKVQLTNP